MEAIKDHVSSGHVMLLPDKNEAKFGKLLHQFIFTFKNVSESELLHSKIPRDEHESKFLHRGMIFVSIFIQIALRYISKPLKIIQFFFEGILNLGAPRDSEKYYSAVGHSDSRLDLDKKLKRGHPNYYPALAMMASKLSYENKAVIKKAVTKHWKMEFVESYNFYNEFQNKFTTQAFICREKNLDGDIIVVAFRGTSMFTADDWSTDFDFSWIEFDGIGKAHMGFMIALGLNKYSRKDEDYLGDFSGSWPKNVNYNHEKPLAYYEIRDKLKEMLANSNNNTRFIVTGHSLGGALAILFPSILALHNEVDLLERLEAIYTFGQPRVGDAQFGNFVKDKLRKFNIKYYRIVYNNDLVPEVPLDNTMMTFKHFGKFIHFNCFYHAKIEDEEKEQDVNTVLWLIKWLISTLVNFVVARLSAIYEFERGFFIGFTRGPDYREGWALTLIRLVGIVVPSIVNHVPQDYVNSTRLASKDVFEHSPDLPY
ncbi:putative feruloyl esterase A [Bienertia sinuspersici]